MKTAGEKMKEAAEKCCKAFADVTDAINKLSRNKKYASRGSKFHK